MSIWFYCIFVFIVGFIMGKDYAERKIFKG